MRRLAYLKPHPVPPSTMAATRMAPAMEPIIRLVALGPVKEVVGGGEGDTSVSTLAEMAMKNTQLRTMTNPHGTENKAIRVLLQ